MKTRYKDHWNKPNAEIDEMVGKTMVSVETDVHDEVLTFTDTDGVRYIFYHEQDCCEHVSIEEIIGDLDDLLDTPIIVAEEVEGESGDHEYESCTWTFYNFRTHNGTVTVRWCGRSNGYYSEAVNFRIEED